MMASGYSYRRCDDRAEIFLAREIATMAEAHLKPKLPPSVWWVATLRSASW